MDFDAAAVAVKVGGVLVVNKENINVGFNAQAYRKGPTVNAEFKTKKVCVEENCYQLNTNAYIGIGTGIDLGFGYNHNKKSKKSSLTFSGGLV